MTDEERAGIVRDSVRARLENDNDDVNRVLYAKAKEMLKHRSGTEFDDMYWIDKTSGKIVVCATGETIEKSVRCTEKIKKAIKGRRNLITIHTYPGSQTFPRFSLRFQVSVTS